MNIKTSGKLRQKRRFLFFSFLSCSQVRFYEKRLAAIAIQAAGRGETNAFIYKNAII